MAKKRRRRREQPQPSSELENQLLGLKTVLDSTNTAAHPELLTLQARAHLLEGSLPQALALFEQALALNPSSAELQLNTGAARLANNDSAGSLQLLQPLYARLEELEEPALRSSVRNNLILAQLAAGETPQAAELLRRWLEVDADAVDGCSWLEQAEALREQGDAEGARILLNQLAEAGTAAHRKAALPLLAAILDDQGACREAALLYRELLRPTLTAPA